MIGARIRQARLGANLTLGALGEQVGVTHTAIQKYEKEELTPSSSQLLKLAKACGTRVEYFFRANHVQLHDTEFRKRTTFGKTVQEALRIKVLELVEKRVDVLSVFPQSPLPPFRPLSTLPDAVTALDQIDAIADQTRLAWNLGLDPIRDLTDTLEHLGFMVLVVEEDHAGFSGMTATARIEGGQSFPVIAVSSKWPGDRQRFTLAHELAHRLLHGRLAAELDEEKACDRFAGAFLVPETALRRLLGVTRRHLEWQELYAVKHEFGISMAGALQRALQCHILSPSAHLTMWKMFSAKGWRQQEPGTPLPQERSRLFEHLVYRGLGEHYLSEAKAAELLGMPMMLFYKARQLELLGAGTDQ